MTVNKLVLRDLDIYALRASEKDPESMARFHQECTPERILAILEEFKEMKEWYEGEEDLRSQIQDLRDDLETAEDKCGDYHRQVEELQDEIKELRG
jgi:peptidoglycan hydrolase CwlO-like protein